ncbi:hypothetical protein FRC11_002152, partial [Ceratobasidium sp. 423]
AYRNKNTDTSKFWKELDELMHTTELELAEHVPNQRDCDAPRARLYASALEDHEKNYPNQVPAREPVDTPSWQIMLERNLAKNHSF